MSALDFPHITLAPGDVARFKRLPRIRVAQIVTDYLGRGWSVEEIAVQYPHLTLAEIHSALAYYHDHPEVIDRELADELSEVQRLEDEQAASPLLTRLRMLKRQAAV